jgi:hypothetical protein
MGRGTVAIRATQDNSELLKEIKILAKYRDSGGVNLQRINNCMNWWQICGQW